MTVVRFRVRLEDEPFPLKHSVESCVLGPVGCGGRRRISGDGGW